VLQRELSVGEVVAYLELAAAIYSVEEMRGAQRYYEW
jgi:hypothetical protein